MKVRSRASFGQDTLVQQIQSGPRHGGVVAFIQYEAPSTRHPVSVTQANAAVASCVFFVLCCALLHIVQPELGPVDDAISYYMNGAVGRVLGAGLVALGLGSLALSRALRERSRAGALLLALWGVGAILGGIFPPDPRGQWDRPPSISGMIHGGAAMLAFVAFPIAAWLLSRNVRRLRALAAICAILLGVFFACLAPVFRNHAPYSLGLVERILIACYLAWIVVAARSIGTASPAVPVHPPGSAASPARRGTDRPSAQTDRARSGS
jgi:hypothetical membrane protein